MSVKSTGNGTGGESPLDEIHKDGESSIGSYLSEVESMTGVIELNGVKFAPKRGPGRIKKTVLYPKSKRVNQTEEQRMKLIETIQSKQQTLYHSITISVNDPEKMTNTYSLANLLSENRRNIAKYDLLDVYNVVFPLPGCFDQDSATEGALLTKGGKIKTMSLFDHYLQLTPEAVAQSSKYYSLYVPEERRYEEDLEWSLAYYEKNVEADLYSKIYNLMIRYEPDAQGGPLFLKLLLDRVTTSGEATLKSLTQTIKTYSIKKNCDGEDVDKVASMFSAIVENIDALNNGTLPTDTVDDLLRLFQTTSVPTFNIKFSTLQEALADAEINNDIDLNYRLQENHTTTLRNDLKSAQYVLHYAERTYRRLLKNGTWDEHLQKTPGKASFLGATDQPAKFTPPTECSTVPPVPAAQITGTGICFNCERPGCRVETCPFPRDPERIAKNKAKHPTFIRLNKIKEKWRAPDPHENNKRVINGAPHTWNSTGGRNGRGRWIRDDAPPDGQPNDGGPPQVQFATSDLSAGDASSLTALTNRTPSSTMSTSERKLQLHMAIERAQRELAAL